MGAQQIGQWIGHPAGVSGIVQMRIQPVDDAEPIHDLALDQCTGFAGQMLRPRLDLYRAVESGCEKRLSFTHGVLLFGSDIIEVTS